MRGGLPHTIPYRKDEVPTVKLYVTECTRFAAASPSMVFGWKQSLSARIDSSMRRRSRRGPNTSESTGKIGQELPSNQPAPLVPFYPDDVPARQTAAPRTHEHRQVQPPRPH